MEVQGTMNNPRDCYLLLLHIWWNTWVQGDLRKLYVAGVKIKVMSMKPHSPEDTDSYVKGRGCGNLGTGLRFIRTPCLEPVQQSLKEDFRTVH